jgi:PAS domain S-box-containing protein
MAKARIFIVEDASVVALDLQRALQNMGYQVLGIFSSGEEAVETILNVPADLVMMDIRLKGKMDGIETAAALHSKIDIPVVYLTAYSDQETLDRAKLTDPFGYVIKPFDDRELNTAIEMALYKHKMERKLKASEKWLSTTLQSIGDAVIATDDQGRVIFLNPVAQKLTGWDEAGAYHQPLADVFNIISEATGEPMKNPVEKVFELGAIVGLANHTLLINRDGQTVPIDDSAAPIRDSSGKIDGVVLVFRDIAERRKTELELEQSEARYRAVVEQAVEGIYLLDYETKRVVEANQAFASLLGYSMDEIIGMPVYQLLNHQEIGVDQRILQLVNQRQPMIDERQYLDKQGNIVEVRVSASLISFGGREVVCTVVHDISELKRTEKALRESETRFRVLANAIPDMMLRITKDGKVLDTKPALDFISPLANVERDKNVFDLLEPELKNSILQTVERSIRFRSVISRIINKTSFPDNGTARLSCSLGFPFTTIGYSII